ncbi:MAG: FAD-dependent oxidoreductase [Oscillospiraceae bacterium]|nr:FAD-dependent oxidoreductase [Oscillospiraceae bacterium]
MERYDVIVVGAGPAGLGAAIEAGRAGARVLLLDEHDRPGGQLFKQIHKFFGSQAHHAGTRGYAIGQMLLQEAAEAGVTLGLGQRVWGIFPDGSVTSTDETTSTRRWGNYLVLATGAAERAVSFPGCTLPGVMTAGAAQTLVNLQHVLPGREAVMVGAGNVGLIVSYQLLQAGVQVQAVVEAMPEITGYAVHAGKVQRAGVPILTGHTVVQALGDSCLEGVELAALDAAGQPIPDSRRLLPCDTLCLAVGLNPRMELAAAAQCELVWSGPLGGLLPRHNARMETSNPHILVAGDLAGIEEASTALDEGRMAGLGCAYKLGLLDPAVYSRRCQEVQDRLDSLRQGPFGARRRTAKEEVFFL